MTAEFKLVIFFRFGCISAFNASNPVATAVTTAGATTIRCANRLHSKTAHQFRNCVEIQMKKQVCALHTIYLAIATPNSLRSCRQSDPVNEFTANPTIPYDRLSKGLTAPLAAWRFYLRNKIRNTRYKRTECRGIMCRRTR